jgi:hypothetical protein
VGPQSFCLVVTAGAVGGIGREDQELVAQLRLILALVPVSQVLVHCG